MLLLVFSLDESWISTYAYLPEVSNMEPLIPNHIDVNLVGGLNPSEKYSSVGMIIPNIWENKEWQPNHQPVIDVGSVPGIHFGQRHPAKGRRPHQDPSYRSTSTCPWLVTFRGPLCGVVPIRTGVPWGANSKAHWTPAPVGNHPGFL